MNKTYRLIWSDTRQVWVVTSELANARGKPSRVRPAIAMLAGALASFGSHAQVPAPNTLPTGGQIVGGQASIATAGATMNIQQSSQRAILNWQSFNIGANATVNFQQPNAGAVALNRVLGADPSAIYGNLNANGQVFLLNPSGVVFGPGARVDVGGLVASALNIRNEDFLSGHYRFNRDGASGSVVNQGDLFGKYVALLAPEVRNEGVIMASQGAAALAAGDAVTLNIAGSNLVGVQVDKASINTLVENRRLIQADEGLVILSSQSANALVGKVVNTGTIQAGGITTDGGVVRLVASSAVEHSGSIQADAGANGKGGTVLVIADLANPASRADISGTISAKGGARSGDGGFIETSATRLKIADSARIDTSAPFGATGQWLLDPYDFTIAAANGDITGTALGAALVSSNITIQTANTAVSCTNATCGTGNASGNGDIFVNDAVTWASDTKLTLSAWRNVHINAPVSVNGAGGSLALEFAQSDVEANMPPGIYTVSAPVNLAASTTFSTKAGSDGIPVNYTVINDATGLANIAANLARNYVLGNDVATSGEWTPIGSFADPYVGLFDGLGHKVTGLTHTNTGTDVDVGLFGVSNSLIQNVGVTGVNISGSQNVGALVGTNNGFVVNSYATGTVQGTGGGDVGRIGGLAGYSMGPIQGSYANVTVTATSGNQANDPMFMEDPLSTGRGGIGGLAGVVGSAVTDSYARGNVTGKNAVGGLVGFSGASISSSYSTGLVTRSSGTSTNIGGFVGEMMSLPFPMPFIFNSFWDTTTSGQASGGSAADAVPGGLVGRTTTQMQTPSTFGTWDTSVAWELRSGQYPLLKQLLQPIFVIADNKSAAYTGSAFTAFTSTVSPTTAPGGAYTGTVTYTPSTASPTNAATYTVTPGGVSVTSASDQHGYRVQFVDGTLVITPAAVSASLDTAASKTYDGTNIFNNTHSYTLTGMVNGDPEPTVVSGTATVSSANAGTYNSFVTNALVLSDSNYALTGSVSATIDPKTVTLTAPNVSKTYDGGLTYTTLAGDLTTLSGQLGVSGDTVSAATIAYLNRNAGSGNKTVTFGAVTISDGNSGNNYNITLAGNSSSTITPKTVTLTAPNVSRTYDGGLTYTTLAGDLTTLSGQLGVSGDTVSAATIAYANRNAGSGNKTVTFDAATISDGNSGNNYDVTLAGNSSSTITPKTVTLTAPNVSKTYDGGLTYTTLAGDLTTLSGLLGVSGDTVSAATIAYTNRNAGSGNKTVTFDAATISDGNSGNNYDVTLAGNSSSTITPKTVTLTAPNVSKTYDGGLTYATIAGDLTALSGQLGVSGDTVSAATIAYANRNAGSGNKTVTFDAATISDGNSGNNYSITRQGNSTSTINQKAVTLTAPNVSKTYDGGLTYTTLAGDLTTLSGLLGVSGDTVSAATIAYTDRNAGTGNKTVTLDAATVSDGNGGNNYSITRQGNSTSTITPKALSVLGITGVPSELNAPPGFSGGTVGQQFAIPTALSGSPVLQDAIAPGTGDATDGKPYNVDGPFTFSGTPSANTWTATAVAGTATNVNAPVTGLALAGTGSTNYTVTGTSVSSKILSSASAIVQLQRDQVVNQTLETLDKPTTTTSMPTTTTSMPVTTTTTPQTTTTDAPPPASTSGRTSNPTPNPGEAVPISVPASDNQPVLDPSKPAAAVMLPASGAADIPMPTPTITQNANGSMNISVTVPPSTPPGVYLIAVVGTDATGRSRAVIVPVVVRRARAA